MFFNNNPINLKKKPRCFIVSGLAVAACISSTAAVSDTINNVKLAGTAFFEQYNITYTDSASGVSECTVQGGQLGTGQSTIASVALIAKHYSNQFASVSVTACGDNSMAISLTR